MCKDRIKCCLNSKNKEKSIKYQEEKTGSLVVCPDFRDCKAVEGWN